MLPRIIVALIVLGAVFYAVYRIKRLSADEKKSFIKKLIITGVIVLLGVLALTGRLHWVAAAIGALLTFLPRVIRFTLGAWPAIAPYFKRYRQNKQSNMKTRFLSMQINMLSGELQGDVLEGHYKGKRLQELNIEQLAELLEEFQQQDAESAALLQAYLHRTHSGWTSSKEQASNYSHDASAMTEQQARDILGVSSAAKKEEIIKAHKRLMQKLHPDRGGSDYLAVQINQAREVLLKLF